MALIDIGVTDEMKIYLTELGREKLLNQGFIPSSFSMSDEDVNYNANASVIQRVVDLTGDYNDQVYSLSKNIEINNLIIQ